MIALYRTAVSSLNLIFNVPLPHSSCLKSEIMIYFIFGSWYDTKFPTVGYFGDSLEKKVKYIGLAGVAE
jgi:hypothetical protein